jgi:hypothetical protein
MMNTTAKTLKKERSLVIRVASTSLPTSLSRDTTVEKMEFSNTNVMCVKRILKNCVNYTTIYQSTALINSTDVVSSTKLLDSGRVCTGTC